MKNPSDTPSKPRMDATAMNTRILQRILDRSDSMVWRAIVTLAESNNGGDGEPAFHWDFRFVSSSQKVEEWLGLVGDGSRDGEVWSSRFLPEHRSHMERRTRDALLGGESGYDQEFPLKGRDGQIRWVHETVEVEPLEEGRWELVGMISDISPRKNAEDSLQQTEARFRSVWEGSQDAMRLTDADGVIVAVNPAFCGLVEMDESEVVGQPLKIVYSDRDREGALERYRQRVRDGLRERFFERHVTLWCGRDVTLEWSMAPLQSEAEGFLCLTILRDMTNRRSAEQALRRSEAFFRSIWESSTDGMRLTDAEGKVLAANDAFCRIVELPREKLLGQPFYVAYDTGESAETMLEGYRQRIRNRDFKTRHQTCVTLCSGRIKYLDLSLSETQGDGKGPTFLTLFRDMTEDKLAEERRLKLERKMLDAQRLESLGILAGGIAHDFNNLLTAILGNASLAMMQLSPSSTLRPFIEGVETSSLQAADLCKQMLAYSGHGRIEFRSVYVNEILEDMNHLLEVSINKQIILRFKLASELPPIKAEPSQIQQVIMNLVTNASEAVGNRSGAITISTSLIRVDRSFLEETFLAPDLPEGDYVSIEVADTGCGMPPETKERIFDPFFTTKFTGRGLGLAAVLGILQRHKGAFKVYSEPSQGTTFKVLLPAVELKSEREQAGEKASQSQMRGTILVVDDEQSVRAVAARMLEKCGMTVLLAKDGGEAVEVFRRHQHELDLVLLDMTMPVMNGDEAFRQIRRLRPETKVLLMSGYTEADSTDRFAGKGLAGFIQKPFRWEHLRAKLEAILGGDSGREVKE